MVYTTIVMSPGLDRAQHQEAVRLGPPAVDASAPDDVLMQKAGLTDVRIEDVTSDFLGTARAWLDEFSRHESDVKAILGEAEWDERQDSRQLIVTGIRTGLLRRVLVYGRAAR